MTLKLEIATPVGRIVQGSLYKPNTTDFDGNPLVWKSGQNAGQPRQETMIALAIEKSHPSWPAFHAQLVQLARTAFPQFFDGAGNCTHPGFAWKIIDGDGVSQHTGKRWADNEGFAGHWVLRLSTSFSPQLLQMQNGTPVAIPATAGEAIKRGYFAQAVIGVEPNGNVQKPGLYNNLNAVVLVGYGAEISGGVDVGAALRAAPQAPANYVPAGMSLTPPAGVSMQAPAVPQMPAPQAPAMQPPVAAPLAQPTPVTTAAPQAPMTSVAATPAGAPSLPTPPGGFVAHVLGELKATPMAQGHSLDAWKAMGWTEDQLVAQGYFTR